MNPTVSGPCRAGPEVLVDDRRAPDPPGSTTPVADAGVDPDALGELLSSVLAAEGVGADAEAGLHLVGEAEMSTLNAQHMGHTGPTDVLSFPIDLPSVSSETPGSGGPTLVGDLVICVEVAEANAPGHAGSLVDELNLLVVHGGLHLCGWDHLSDEERRRMWDRERQLMDALGVRPTNDPWSGG